MRRVAYVDAFVDAAVHAEGEAVAGGVDGVDEFVEPVGVVARSTCSTGPKTLAPVRRCCRSRMSVGGTKLPVAQASGSGPGSPGGRWCAAGRCGQERRAGGVVDHRARRRWQPRRAADGAHHRPGEHGRSPGRRSLPAGTARAGPSSAGRRCRSRRRGRPAPPVRAAPRRPRSSRSGRRSRRSGARAALQVGAGRAGGGSAGRLRWSRKNTTPRTRVGHQRRTTRSPWPGSSLQGRRGMPAACIRCTASAAVSGVCSAGLASTGLPAASGPPFLAGEDRQRKFHGLMHTTGPARGRAPGQVSRSGRRSSGRNPPPRGFRRRVGPVLPASRMHRLMKFVAVGFRRRRRRRAAVRRGGTAAARASRRQRPHGGGGAWSMSSGVAADEHRPSPTAAFGRVGHRGRRDAEGRRQPADRAWRPRAGWCCSWRRSASRRAISVVAGEMNPAELRRSAPNRSRGRGIAGWGWPPSCAPASSGSDSSSVNRRLRRRCG